jgi:hypothetical protein
MTAHNPGAAVVPFADRRAAGRLLAGRPLTCAAARCSSSTTAWLPESPPGPRCAPRAPDRPGALLNGGQDAR